MKHILGYSPVVSSRIRELLADKESEAVTGSWQADFLSRLVPFATAGKLLRGSLVCFSYEAFTAKGPTRPVLDTAAALELVHSSLLIHDDVMDNDDFRRGKPSLHSQYQAVALKAGLQKQNSVSFGANMAICGGDMCLFFAFGLLSDVPGPVCPLFADMLAQVCDGQMQDIYLQARPGEISKRSIYSLMKTKTAAYTVSLPLMTGAALAGEPPATLGKLRRLGDYIGMIFQIRDDELGVMGSSHKTGKPVGADIREGKKTLVRYYLMKKCDRMERQALRSIFGNSDLTDNDVITVQKLIRKHGIRKTLNDEVRHLEAKALRTLESFNLSHRGKNELKSLIEFCSKRQA